AAPQEEEERERGDADDGEREDAAALAGRARPLATRRGPAPARLARRRDPDVGGGRVRRGEGERVIDALERPRGVPPPRVEPRARREGGGDAARGAALERRAPHGRELVVGEARVEPREPRERERARALRVGPGDPGRELVAGARGRAPIGVLVHEAERQE